LSRSKKTGVLLSAALSLSAGCQGGSNAADNRPGTTSSGIGGAAGTSSGSSGVGASGASSGGAAAGGVTGAGAPSVAGNDDPGEGGEGGQMVGQGGSNAGTSGAGAGGGAGTAEGGQAGAPTCSECLDTQCASERAACENDSECGPCLSCLETSMSLAECPFPDPCNLAPEGPTFDLLECGLDQCVMPCGI
jgi:hypothetical protein